MKITDQTRLAELREEYRKNHDRFIKPVYVSKFSESSRILKLIRVIKVAKPLEETFKTLLSMLAKDMNDNLTYADLENDAFYRAGSKNKKREMHLAAFVENKEATLEWFTSDGWFTKNFLFISKNKNQKTKIIYTEIVKSLKAKKGYLEQIMRNSYIKAELIRFDMQMYQLQKNLNLLTEKQLSFYNLKMSKLKERLSKIRLFSN